MNNCCFYQHPNLMRALDMHTTVMDIMVNVLGGSTEAGKQISTSQVSYSRNDCDRLNYSQSYRESQWVLL